jgi:hypothetical protein
MAHLVYGRDLRVYEMARSVYETVLRACEKVR